MNNVKSNWRTDDQLEAILCETGHWAISGQQGRTLCFAASLRRALDRSAEYAASGAVVVALCRLPSDNIIVFPAQIERLRKLIADRERSSVGGRRSEQAPSRQAPVTQALATWRKAAANDSRPVEPV